MMTHEEQQKQLTYIRAMLGIRYTLRGMDIKTGLDCFSCTKLIQKDLFGRDIPHIEINDDSAIAFVRAVIYGRKAFDWLQIEEPIHGCIVELSRGNDPHHIGTYINLPDFKVDGLVHCLKGAGVVYDPRNMLKAAGWKRFTYNVPRNL